MHPWEWEADCLPHKTVNSPSRDHICRATKQAVKSTEVLQRVFLEDFLCSKKGALPIPTKCPIGMAVGHPSAASGPQHVDTAAKPHPRGQCC